MAEKQLKVMVVAAHPQDPFERAGAPLPSIWRVAIAPSWWP